MKKFLKFTLCIMLVFGVLLLSSCGLSEEEKAMREIQNAWTDISEGRKEILQVSVTDTPFSSSFGCLIKEETIQECLSVCQKIDIDALIPEKTAAWEDPDIGGNLTCSFFIQSDEEASSRFVISVDRYGRARFVWETGKMKYTAFCENSPLTRDDLRKFGYINEFSEDGG